MKNLQIYTGVRYATPVEINIYQWVNEFLKNLDDEDFTRLVELTSEYAIEPSHRNYQRVYRMLKKLYLLHIITVPDMRLWWFIEEV